MRIVLPVYVEDFNMGAQYHNFLYSILMTRQENRFFFYRNYLQLMVKHMHQSHVDFAFDGIYACDRGPLQKFIIRGPVQDLHQIIKEALSEGCYVILNVNERHLPCRDAYGKYIFRHDLLIYGFDEEERCYLTLGLDHQYHYRRQEYPFSTVETAYFHMQAEWDYELFLYRLDSAWKPDWTEEQMIRQGQEYLLGKAAGRDVVRDFLKGRDICQGFLNDSYYEYYGIGVYDYLEKRIKRRLSFFDGEKKERDGASGLGATDSRSVQVLLAHKKLFFDFLQDRELWGGKKGPVHEDLLRELEQLQEQILSAKMLLMQVIFGGGRKDGKRILVLMQKAKEMDRQWMEKLLRMMKGEIE